MLNASRIHSLVTLHGDAQTAARVGSHCMVKLFGPKLAHIGQLIITVDLEIQFLRTRFTIGCNICCYSYLQM